MLTCFDVAKYFLAKIDNEVGDCIANLQLQKLVYYAQAFSLAITGKPIFLEAIEAWQYGPAIPVLYQEYKKYGSAIPKPEGIDFSVFDTETRELLDEVYYVYGQFAAWKLKHISQGETPWIKAFQSKDWTISHSEMTEFYKRQID